MRTLLSVLTVASLFQMTESACIVVQTEGPPTFYVVAHYDETADPFEHLEVAKERALREGKRILLQVGGEWCGWCHRLDQFILDHPAIVERLSSGYLIMKVTWTSKNQNRPFLSQYPGIPGYPHIFVLDSDGTFLHSQGTLELEQGKSYNEQAILGFLDTWAPGGARKQGPTPR